MNWITIYITGKPGFREEARKKLEHSDLKFMSGYIGNTSELGTDDLYWLDADTDLRKFKEAIGGKIIWKYRLRFFASLEDFLEYKDLRKDPELSAYDRALIEEMRNTSEVDA